MKNTIPPPRAAVAGCNQRAPEESLRFIPILIPADHLPDMTRIAAHMGAMMIKVLAALCLLAPALLVYELASFAVMLLRGWHLSVPCGGAATASWWPPATATR